MALHSMTRLGTLRLTNWPFDSELYDEDLNEVTIKWQMPSAFS
jgi:hypothetical protein